MSPMEKQLHHFYRRNSSYWMSVPIYINKSSVLRSSSNQPEFVPFSFSINQAPFNKQHQYCLHKTLTQKQNVVSNTTSAKQRTRLNFVEDTSLLTFIASLCAILGFGLSKSKEVECKSAEEANKTEYVKVNSQTIETNNTRDVIINKKGNNLNGAIIRARKVIKRYLKETGSPGLAITVSIKGSNVWSKGFGEQDVENKIALTRKSVLRIASISKPLTMAAVALLVEDGKLKLDDPVRNYVPNFPKKYFDGQEVTITVRHLLSHLSGIRHYSILDKKKTKVNKETETEESIPKPKKEMTNEEKVHEKIESLRQILSKKMFDETKKRKKSEDDEFSLEEYYIKENFNSINEALTLFQDDDLLHKPGESFLYSTHAWTLVSAVIESASGKTFKQFMEQLFDEMLLSNTFFETNDRIIYNRSKHYIRNSNALLKNAPYVDNSYKWAGGGFLSTTDDLVRFGNIMLSSFQNKNSTTYKPLLKSETVKEMWKPIKETKEGGPHYGLGWVISPVKESPLASAKNAFSVWHTGGAVGACSILVIVPSEIILPNSEHEPDGVVVAIIINQGSVPVTKLGKDIASIFTSCNY